VVPIFRSAPPLDDIGRLSKAEGRSRWPRPPFLGEFSTIFRSMNSVFVKGLLPLIDGQIK